MKRFIGIQIIIVLVGLTAGLAGRLTFADSGVADISCIEDIEKLNCNLYSLYEDEDYDYYAEDYLQDIIDECDGADNILVIEPTGIMIQNDFSLIQEAKVISCIAGNARGNDNILLQSTGGVSVEFIDEGKYGNKNPVIYHFSVNFMQKGNRYLVFCEGSGINQYLKKDVYHQKTTLFPYLNLTSNDSYYLENNVSYNDFRESEFFADSERILNLMLGYKKEVVHKYAKEFIEYDE